MPLYEYQCDGTCRQRFEVIQKFSDPPVEKCPNCGGPVHKLMSAPGFQFKGSGWYITDYARKDHSPSGKSEPGSSPSSSDSKDAKPAADKTEKPAETKSTGTTPPAAKDK
ncbi:MAG TPA: FmdB family zinc ribbon protein [Vicinamibacterales bacterium]|jgi:putative FmdB family regulatory protein